MKKLQNELRGLPTATTIQERNAQELQLLVNSLFDKAREIGFTVSISFAKIEKCYCGLIKGTGHACNRTDCNQPINL